MGKITEILTVAKQRGQDLNLPYAGALTPQEAWELMQSAPGVRVVDVRTRAEYDWVGRIPGSELIEWTLYPGMKPNPFFMEQLEQSVDKEALVIFVCRSAARSHSAAIAASQAGYTECYNMLEGFEGDRNSDGQRNRMNGWRTAELPWEQS